VGFRAQALTLAPSVVLLAASVYLSILSLQVLEDLPSELMLFVFAACFFFAGVVFALCWFAYWGLYKALKRL